MAVCQRWDTFQWGLPIWLWLVREFGFRLRVGFLEHCARFIVHELAEHPVVPVLILEHQVWIGQA